MRASRRTTTNWPAWKYGPYGEAVVFEKPEDVPFGWTDKPQEQFTPPEAEALDHDALVKALLDLGVEINPIWGDAHLKKVLDDRSPPR